MRPPAEPASLPGPIDAEIPAGQGTLAPARSWLRAYSAQVAALLWKDLVVELRTRDVLTSMLVFGLLSLTVFTFAFDLRTEGILLATPGILWVSVLFSGMLGLGRSYSHERERGSMEGLLLCPMDRSAIFVAKFLTNFFLLLAVEVVLVPVFAAFFDVAVFSGGVVAIILLGTVGFAAVGTVFGAMAANTRAREVMLPVLMLPILVPLLIAAVKATGLLMDGGPWSSVWTWANLLIGFDVVYLVVSFVVFEFVVEDWG